MSFTVQHIRSNEPDRRPKPEDLVDGQIAINMHDSGPGMFFRTAVGNLVKVGPAYISGVEPVPMNHTPFLLGEQWLDTSSTNPVLKFWDGQDWLEAGRDMSNVEGDVLPGTDCQYDLGSPSQRWGNLFTCDIDLSNEGGFNDVDGTWGSYVIQEGKDDLFLLNRRSGKKFKFVLQEVE